ncbi:MAG: RhuM family protein [Kiritimatiellia bacterium]
MNCQPNGSISPRANFAHTTAHGALAGKTQTQVVVGYNLDVIISVGYRVHSRRGVEFRRWATTILKGDFPELPLASWGAKVYNQRLFSAEKSGKTLRRAE